VSCSISTGTGDGGTTGLASGERVSKTDSRVEECGAVDELSAQLGILRAHLNEAGKEAQALEVAKIQSMLSTVCGRVAAGGVDAASVGDESIVEVEKATEWMQAGLPRLRRFVLPGGVMAAAQAHLACTVCRRAERRLVCVLEDGRGSPDALKNELIYLNRLSDYLFVLARYCNKGQETEGI